MAFPVTVNLSQGKISTDPEEFKRFNEILMANAPEGYEPYYLVLARNGKDPQPGGSWKQNRKTFEEAYSLMKLGFNIGIAGTDKDNLVIVDADDLALVGKIKPTLTTISRKRIGRHGFYFTDDPLARTIYDNSAKQNIATEDAGEVRSVWQYVVCAGSYVPCSEEEIYRIPEEDRANAGKYSLFVENEVSNIAYSELPEIYRACLENKRAVNIANKQKKVMKPLSQGKDTKNKSAMWDIDIETVSGEHNDQTRRFPSPFHGSKTFKDTSVSHDMLHCWRHNCSHTALTYLAVASGISTCSQAGFPHGGGSSGVDMEDPKTVFTIWKYAKDMGLIPQEDPIPQAAMRYIAKKYGIHDCNNLEEGWKLPIETYNKGP